MKAVYFVHLENISPGMSPVAQPQPAAIQVNSGAGGRGGGAGAGAGAGAGEGGRRKWQVEMQDEMSGVDGR